MPTLFDFSFVVNIYEVEFSLRRTIEKEYHSTMYMYVCVNVCAYVYANVAIYVCVCEG